MWKQIQGFSSRLIHDQKQRENLHGSLTFVKLKANVAPCHLYLYAQSNMSIPFHAMWAYQALLDQDTICLY